MADNEEVNPLAKKALESYAAFREGYEADMQRGIHPEPSDDEGDHEQIEDDVVPSDAWLSEEDFSKLSDEGKAQQRARLKFEKQREERLRDLEAKLDRYVETATQNQQQNQQQAQRPGEAQTLQDVSLQQLQDYRRKAQALMLRAAQNPDDEALREEVAKVNVDNLQQVEDEIIRRRASEYAEAATAPLKKKYETQEKAASYKALAEQMIAEHVGGEALADGDLKKQAIESLQGLMQRFGIPEDDSRAQMALAVQAFELAQLKRARGGEGRDTRALRRRELADGQSQASASRAAGSPYRGAKRSREDEIIDIILNQ